MKSSFPIKTKPEEVWYRYEDHMESVFSQDYDGEYYPTGQVKTVLTCCEFAVVKHTAKGVRLDMGSEWDHTQMRYVHKTRFVRDGTRKQFAHSNKRLALLSFIRRKKWQEVKIKERLESCQNAQKIAEYQLGQLAQSVEQGTLNAPVSSSSLELATSFLKV